jgi:uncharacterized GH25 family protein
VEKNRVAAEGIVENAAMFTGVVRTRTIQITLRNYDDELIPNTKCKLTFQDGQTTVVKSDDKGVIKFLTKTQGEFKIELLEEEESSKESSEG